MTVPSVRFVTRGLRFWILALEPTFSWEVRAQSIFRTKVIYFSTKDENITIPTEMRRAKK